MPLIHCKIHLELNWTKNCVIYGGHAYNFNDGNNRETTFKITNTKLYVPIATPSTKDNINLTKQLNEGFMTGMKDWNEYKTKTGSKKFR